MIIPAVVGGPYGDLGLDDVIFTPGCHTNSSVYPVLPMCGGDEFMCKTRGKNNFKVVSCDCGCCLFLPIRGFIFPFLTVLTVFKIWTAYFLRLAKFSSSHVFCVFRLFWGDFSPLYRNKGGNKDFSTVWPLTKKIARQAC